jgi:quinol monooxygenase YgiN
VNPVRLVESRASSNHGCSKAVGDNQKEKLMEQHTFVHRPTLIVMALLVAVLTLSGCSYVVPAPLSAAPMTTTTNPEGDTMSTNLPAGTSDAAYNILSNQVQYMVEWTIKEGQLATAQAMAASTVETVAANEPEMMAFHWYLDEDESKLYLLEWFANADAMVVHFDHIGPSLTEFFNFAQITRFEVYGDLSGGAQAAVSALGATTFEHYSGFTRMEGATASGSPHMGHNQVQYVVEWTVNEGDLAIVQKMAADAVQLVLANEPDMLAFHWYISTDSAGLTKLYLVEWFADADAILAHFDTIGPTVNELFTYARITRFEVFGDLSAESQASVEQMGAQTFEHYAGFTR